jgi:multidrug resistance efflux pump
LNWRRKAVRARRVGAPASDILPGMDPEKTMQFLLDMQVKHEAQLAQNEAQIARNMATIAQNTAAIAQNTAQLATVADLIGRLAQAEIRLVERMDRLSESQAHSDRRLDALIDVVDKLLRRNGGAPKA